MLIYGQLGTPRKNQSWNKVEWRAFVVTSYYNIPRITSYYHIISRLITSHVPFKSKFIHIIYIYTSLTNVHYTVRYIDWLVVQMYCGAFGFIYLAFHHPAIFVWGTIAALAFHWP
jgi:hypothetical protein